MAQQASITYSVLTLDSGQWVDKGSTGDIGKALSAARQLLAGQGCRAVKVDQQFFDAEAERTVTTTVFEEAAQQARPAGRGLVRAALLWAALGLAIFAVGFGIVLAADAILT